ncbi:MAG: hypothetical protein KAU20_02305 [Nanoarchaeota archaeon]|nr:hypothetical protein [Nanoarchaeota archaeon]
MTKTIDIETAPDMKMVKWLPDPDVKYGNTKDEEKRKVMRDDAVMRQIQGMDLSPLSGTVVCAVIVQDGTVISECLVEKKGLTEWELLDLVFDNMRLSGTANPTLCTWNGTSFDLPFLYKRAMIHDKLLNSPKSKRLLVNMPPLSYWSKRYQTVPHCDLPLVWGGWDSQAKYTSLQSVVLPLLQKSKIEIDFDMEEHHKLLKSDAGRQKILKRCVQDTLLTDEVYHLVKGVLF